MHRQFWGSAAIAGGALLAMTGLLNRPGQAQSAESRPQFEVASIKPVPGRRDGPPDSIELNMLMGMAALSRNGQFSMRDAPLGLLIQLAYKVRDFQVQGGPSWASSDRYNIVAKADGNATFDQMRPMLQSLLADRFRLTLRRETKELPVYELTVAKGGLKITAAKQGSCVPFDPNNPPPPLNPNRPPPLTRCGGVIRRRNRGLDNIEALGITMPKLIEMVSDEVERNIVDKTGFTGTFNFQLEFTPQRTNGPTPVGDPASAEPSTNLSAPAIFTALQEQLGLQLKPAKGPVEVLAIDHVERPTAN